jgi:hypothetical protein
MAVMVSSSSPVILEVSGKGPEMNKKELFE